MWFSRLSGIAFGNQIKDLNRTGRTLPPPPRALINKIHMPPILLECKNCGKVFPSGISVGQGSSVTLMGNKSRCPHCDSMESIPDGIFKATFEGFIRILQTSQDPLREAQELLESLRKSKSAADLEAIKQSPKFSKFSAWIPNTPEKIAAYIAIIYTVVSLLTQKPDVHIEYQTFVNQYNATLNIITVPNQNIDPGISTTP